MEVSIRSEICQSQFTNHEHRSKISWCTFNSLTIQALILPLFGQLKYLPVGQGIRLVNYSRPDFIRLIKFQSLEEIALQAKKLEISQLKLVEGIVDCNIPDIKPSVKKKLATFVKTIRDLRKLEKEVSLFPFPLPLHLPHLPILENPAIRDDQGTC